jgi:hypothetical protein
LARLTGAFLAALLHRLTRPQLRQLHLIVSPDIVLRWHRDLLRRRHAKASRPKRPGWPRTSRSIQAFVLRLARENPSRGYRRIHGELAALGITSKVAPSTIWEILKTNGIEPAPERNRQTWAAFLCSQAHAILAADILRDPNTDRSTAIRLRRHRARHPPRPRPRRHHPPELAIDAPPTTRVAAAFTELAQAI